jgi:protein required for attachment to host cells
LIAVILARHARRFERLLLVAPPHFLGVLRNTIGDGVAALVVASMSKDLTHDSADVTRQRIAWSD